MTEGRQPQPKEKTPMTFHEPPTDSDELWNYVRQLEKKLKNLETKEPKGTPAKNEGPKPAKPPTFGGKIGESVDTWIFHLEQYFLLVTLEPEKRIPFAASYLTDNAATWWRYVFLENERKRATWTWNDFVKNLRIQFRPISAEKTARARLGRLRQATSVSNYANAFRNLMIDIPSMAEEDRLDYFLKGLKADIQERVALQIPKTMNEACDMAQAIDSIRFQIRTQGFQRNFNTQPTPMEIDAIKKGKLTDQEREHLKRIGGCFACREVGHLSRNCPRKKRINVAAVETDEVSEPESGKD
jgi:hypothetical protein